MPDRTIILATNGRHGLRGLTQVNPQEFLAYQDTNDDLTYIADTSAYGEGATLSTVTRTAYGPTVTNTSNTTTRITQRIKGFGYVDIKFTTSAGDSDQFRIVIEPRAETLHSQNYDPPIAVPLAYTATSDPTVNDDAIDGHVPGTLWLNTATLNEFRCISNAAGAARWRHITRTLDQGTTSALTGSTAETQVKSILLAANTLAPGAQLDIHHGWENNNNANTKTRRIRFGSSNDLNGTVITGIGPTTNQSHYNKHVIHVLTTTTQATSIDGIGTTGSYGGFSGTFLTSTVDVTQASYLVFSGQLANSGDNMTLKHYAVTLTRPDIAP